MICVQRDFFVFSECEDLYIPAEDGWKTLSLQSTCITSQQVSLDAATPCFIEINTFSFSTYKKLTALLSCLHLDN